MTFKDDVFLLTQTKIYPHETILDLQNNLVVAGFLVHG
jgi:hypothetical protein